MHYSKMIVTVVGGLFLAACGATVDPLGEDLSRDGTGSTSSALVFCQANCPGGGTISCTGTTCSAADYQYVICDGIRQNCPGCVIGGVYYANGSANPNNRCQWCNTSVSTTSWSNHDYDFTVPGYCKYHNCLASECAGNYCSVNGGNCDASCSGGTFYCGGA